MIFVVIPSRRLNSKLVSENLNRQSFSKFKSIIIENGPAIDHYSGFDFILKSQNDVSSARNVGLQFLKDNYPKSFCIFMDDDDWYGKRYIDEVLDNRLKADMIGKSSIFYKVKEDFVFIKDSENDFSESVHGPTMAGFVEGLNLFPKVNQWGEDIECQKEMLKEGKKIYCTSRENFCGIRRIEEDHTWALNDFFFVKLFETRLYQAVGNFETLEALDVKYDCSRHSL